MEGKVGFWFPLVLLGFGLLAMLGWDSVRDSSDVGWFAYTPATGSGFQLTEHTFVTVYGDAYLPAGFRRSPARDWPWPLLVTGTLVATVAWYGWRAHRAGRGSVRAAAGWALGSGVAVLVAYAVVGMAVTTADPAAMVSSIGLPLLGLGVLAAAWAYFRLESGWRTLVLVTGAVCVVAGAGTVLGAWSAGLLEPLIIGAGLLALARYERSRLLAVVAVAMLVALVAFPTGTLGLLLPAAIALAGAIVVLVRQVSITP